MSDDNPLTIRSQLEAEWIELEAMLRSSRQVVAERDRYRRALEAIMDRWPGLAPHEMAEIASAALNE